MGVGRAGARLWCGVAGCRVCPGFAIRDSVFSVGWSGDAVGGVSVEVGLAVGLCPHDRPFGCEVDAPHAFVDQMMVFRTQGYEVVEIGRSALFPRDDVMELAVVHAHRAVRVGTGLVDGGECASLGSCGGAF